MRIGFIGVGGIAGSYLSSLRKLNQPVAAVCDVNPDRAREVAAREGSASFQDHREMLESVQPDVVFVCIPPGAHTTQVADAARTGAALFVAKPVALDLETARKANAALREGGGINQAGYMARHADVTHKAKELVGDRALGLGMGRFICRMGGDHPWWGKYRISGGQMLEQTTHVFDLLRYFLGDVAEVSAYGHTGLGTDIADFPDSTVCNLKFKSGAVGSITSTCCANAPDGFAAELSGRDFYLKLLLDHHLVGQADGTAVDYTGAESGYFRQVEEFLKAVEAKDQSLVLSSYEDAVRTLAVTVAANRSIETGSAVVVESI